MLPTYAITNPSLQADHALARQLSDRLVVFLAPLLLPCDQHVDARLVRTVLTTIGISSAQIGLKRLRQPGAACSPTPGATGKASWRWNVRGVWT